MRRCVYVLLSNAVVHIEVASILFASAVFSEAVRISMTTGCLVDFPSVFIVPERM